MTPFKAYLCSLPTEEKYFLSFKSNSLPTEQLGFEYLIENSNFPMREISQLKATEDGYVSFVFNNAFYPHLALIYNQYNGVILEKKQETNNQKFYMLYRIIKIKYSSSTNVEIIAEPSQQVLYDYTLNDTHFNMCPNAFNFKTSYIEWGYQKESIFVYNSNDNYRINFSQNMDTDLYAKPPMDINCDLLKIKKEITPTLTYSNCNLRLRDCLWEVMFLQPNKTIQLPQDANPSGVKLDFYTANTKKEIRQSITNNRLITCPYEIVFAPILRADNIVHDFLYRIDADTTCTMSLNGLKQCASDYIISYQILPYMDLIKLVDGVDVESSTSLRTIFLHNANNKFIVANAYKCYCEDNNTFDVNTYGYFSLKQVRYEPIEAYLDTTGLGLENYLDVRNKTSENAKNSLSTIKNPYIQLHTTRIALSFNDGQKYFYDPLMLGNNTFNQYYFQIWLSLEPDITQLYVALRPHTNMTNSVYNENYKKTWNGLNINFDNTLLYEQNQLNTFMAYNKNFYLQKQANYTFKIGGAVAKASVNALNNIIDIGTSSIGAKNPEISKQQSSVEGLKGTINDLYSIGNTIAKIQQDKINTSFQMNNYANAPSQMLGGNTNMLLENRVDKMAIYFELWSSSDLVKKSLLETFLEKGIYLNRYMDAEEIEKYFIFDNTGLDKQFKYIKGNFEFQNSYWENQMNLPYNKLVNNLRNGLFLVSIDEAKDYLPLILQQKFNSDTIIKLHYNEQEFGEWS